MENFLRQQEVPAKYRNKSHPILRIFSIDLPYNFRVPEDTYSYEHDGINFSLRLSKVKGEGYSEEEPLDEGHVISSSMDVRGIPEGGSQYKLVNKDPISKGFRFKYTRLRITCLDPHQDIDDDKIVDAINEFIKTYATYIGDPVVGEIRRDDFFIFHEILLNSIENGYTLSIHLGDVQKHDDAMVLTEEATEQFKDNLDQSPTSSSVFLHKARHLSLNGYPSATILYAEKSMECLLDELLDRNMTDKQEEFLSYIGRANLDKIKTRMKVLGLLTGKKLTHLKEYSQYAKVRSEHRNELFHSDHEITEEDAEEYLEKVKNLRLVLLTNIEDEDNLETTHHKFEYLNGKQVQFSTPNRNFKDTFEKLQEIEWPAQDE